MLCLDISGAFPNVSHPRLIHHLKMCQIPSNLVSFVESFLQGRTTCLRLGEFTDSPKPQPTGIPQGSTLSPILFLYFARTLLPAIEETGATAMGFVDDTNILAWGKTTEENCRKLELAHERCVQWAKTHGATWSPQKYMLIHFTRARKKHNLQASVNIQGFEGKPVPSLRLLGVEIDTKLKWGPHIKKVAEKVDSHMNSLHQLCQSTWGASFQKARHIYTAVVRPAMVYGCKVWAKVDGIDKHASSQIKKLEELQTKALRRITGAYKSVPAQVLQQEADIPPMDLYIQQVALDQSKKDKDRKATEYTREASQKFQRLRSKRARTGQRGSPLYQTRQDKLSQITLTLEQEVNTKQEKQGWMHQKWNQRLGGNQAGEEADTCRQPGLTEEKRGDNFTRTGPDPKVQWLHSSGQSTLDSMHI